jgi:glycosyltransferase involved in cell wall biosynthesis
MRVLIVKATMHPVRGGGAAERTLQLSNALAGMPGIDVTLLTLRAKLTSARREELAGVRVIDVPSLNDRYAVPVLRRRRIVELLRETDVAYLDGHWSLLNALVYRQAVRLGVPYVACPYGTLVVFGRSRLLKRLYNHVIGKDIIRNASRQIAIAGSELADLRGYGASDSSIRMVPNGVHPEAYRFTDDDGFRRRFDLGAAPFLLYMGRLNPIKGPDLLIEGFARVKDRFPAHLLVLAGLDEGMGDRLRSLSRQRELDARVRFVGFISGDMKSAAYNAAELLVIPSRHEAMSIVALESGAAGTPLLVTDRCGLDEVESVGGGFVVPATVDGIAEGIASALEAPEQLPPMGERLRAHTVANYSWESVAGRLADLLREVSLQERG